MVGAACRSCWQIEWLIVMGGGVRYGKILLARTLDAYPISFHFIFLLLTFMHATHQSHVKRNKSPARAHTRGMETDNLLLRCLWPVRFTMFTSICDGVQCALPTKV